MAQLEIPLTPDLVEKLQGVEGLSGDDIDFEALGIDVNAMADQLAEALQRGFSDSMRQSLETLDSVSWYHPGMLSFYFIILFLSYIVFKTKSNIPSIIAFIGVILFIIVSDFLNLIFHDFNAQLFETTTTENIFDLAGLFFTFEIIPPVLFLGLVCIIRWVWNYLSRFCQTPPQQQTKQPVVRKPVVIPAPFTLSGGPTRHNNNNNSKKND